MQHQQIVSCGGRVGIISILGSTGNYCFAPCKEGDTISYAANVARGTCGFLLLPNGGQIRVAGGSPLTHAQALRWYRTRKADCSERFNEEFERYMRYYQHGMFDDTRRKELIAQYGIRRK